MQELSLQELKEIELELLKVFRDFCEENGIRFFLAYGTLLGAVRYKGFIPWDDDVDVLVPREDFDRLSALFQDSEQYRLFSFEKDPAFAFPFMKLCDMTTRKEEFNSVSTLPVGVDIDIFPLDHWDGNLEKAKNEAASILRDISRLERSKAKRSFVVNPLKRMVDQTQMLICRTLGSSYFVKKIVRKSFRAEQAVSAYVGSKTWCVYGERGIIPAEAFADVIEIEFEGELFPAPVGYDTYLTCLYGDYLPEPPKEKQKTHHNFRAYRKA